LPRSARGRPSCGSCSSSLSSAAGLPAGGAAYLALAIVSVVPVFAGVGAVASQLAPTKRLATGLATGVLLIAFALRTVAAISSAGLEWLRWATPLGWAEELRPFADPQPLVLLLPVATGALLLVAAAALAARRDIGSGLLPSRDSAPPRLGLLGSPAALALRSERGALVAWLAGVGAFALLMGVISNAAAPDVISENVQHQLEKLGGRLGRHAVGLAGLLVRLLHAGRQPVLPHADRLDPQRRGRAAA
jgi:polyether ionophore transport system permease protein